VKRLVVNADDLGADPGRNRGIAEGLAAGVVTSVSLLANGPALEDAVERLRALNGRGISLGLHLNLSEGTPLSPGHRLLTGADGDFLGKWTAHDLLRTAPSPPLRAEVAAEIEAQIAALGSRGLVLDHLDGHQHAHVLPGVLDIAVAACLRHGIRWFRLPQEVGPESHGRAESPPRIFSGWARRAQGAVERAGLSSPCFRGLYALGRLDTARLEALVASLPPGLTELMVHPGRCEDGAGVGVFSRFSSADRDRELETLLDPGFSAALEENGVALTRFPAGGQGLISCGF
jgi:predicted glycoside hydrolase/deacetylase ChbG (UPF0249 family)